jgi:hypothetical protein
MIQEVSRFYKDRIASVETYSTSQGRFVKISPLSRCEFIVGAVMATAYAVHNLFKSIVYWIATIFTCLLHEGWRTTALVSIEELSLFSLAAWMGYWGVLCPQTMNEEILHIPRDGLHIPAAAYPVRA